MWSLPWVITGSRAQKWALINSRIIYVLFVVHWLKEKPCCYVLQSCRVCSFTSIPMASFIHRVCVCVCMCQLYCRMTDWLFSFQVPDMTRLMDQSRIHNAQDFRHKVELMFRSSNINQDRTRVLLYNNPPPDLNNFEGTEGIDRYMPSWAVNWVSQFCTWIISTLLVIMLRIMPRFCLSWKKICQSCN